MMRRLLFIFLLLLASVYVGVQLKDDPGYLLIAIHHWTIETTLLVALLALVITFIILHSVLVTLHWLINIPTLWRHWRQRRRAHHAQSITRQGLIEFSEGHWLQAKKHLIKALPDTDTPLLNYLTAARAAQEMGDSKLRDDYLREAQQSMPEAKIAVELTQAQLQLANQQWEQALATLRHLQDLAPQHAYVLKLLMRLYIEVKDWPQLINLLPELKRKKILVGDAYQRLQQRAYLQALLDLIKLHQPEAVDSFIQSLPKHLKYDVSIMAEYSQYLLKNQREAEAEALLRRGLQKQFNEQLIAIYGNIHLNDKQLHFAESLLKTQAHSAALYLCLGRLCQVQQLWGKARTYFEQSIIYGATPSTYLELGNLLEKLHTPIEASHAYKQGLLLMTERGNLEE